jgi:hypothetical protein
MPNYVIGIVEKGFRSDLHDNRFRNKVDASLQVASKWFIPDKGLMRPNVGEKSPKLRRLPLDLQTTAEPQAETNLHNMAQQSWNP